MASEKTRIQDENFKAYTLEKILEERSQTDSRINRLKDDFQSEIAKATRKRGMYLVISIVGFLSTLGVVSSIYLTIQDVAEKAGIQQIAEDATAAYDKIEGNAKEATAILATIKETADYQIRAGTIDAAAASGSGDGYTWTRTTTGDKNKRSQIDVKFNSMLTSNPILLVSMGESPKNKGDFDNVGNFYRLSKTGFSLVLWDLNNTNNTSGPNALGQIHFLALQKI